jgi:acyl-CoA thioester hydrolase
MRFQLPVRVRFRDLDAMRHVHHTAPLLYIEEARAAYWRVVAGRETIDDIDYVVGEVALRYHAPIHYPDTIDVGVRVSEIGTRSFRMEYELHGSGGELLVSGSTVQVLFDYAAGTSVPIAASLRERIEAFESGRVEPQRSVPA